MEKKPLLTNNSQPLAHPIQQSNLSKEEQEKIAQSGCCNFMMIIIGLFGMITFPCLCPCCGILFCVGFFKFIGNIGQANKKEIDAYSQNVQSNGYQQGQYQQPVQQTTIMQQPVVQAPVVQDPVVQPPTAVNPPIVQVKKVNVEPVMEQTQDVMNQMNQQNIQTAVNTTPIVVKVETKGNPTKEQMDMMDGMVNAQVNMMNGMINTQVNMMKGMNENRPISYEAKVDVDIKKMEEEVKKQQEEVEQFHNNIENEIKTDFDNMF